MDLILLSRSVIIFYLFVPVPRVPEPRQTCTKIHTNRQNFMLSICTYQSLKSGQELDPGLVLLEGRRWLTRVGDGFTRVGDG
jgi:hypothetical protein